MLEVGVRFHNRPKQWEYCLPQFIFFTPGLVLRNPRCQSFCSTVNESRRCYVWCIWSFYLNTSLRRNQCNWHKLHNCQKLHGPVHDSVFTSYFFLSDSKIILRWLQADVRSPLNSSRPMSSRGDNDNNCNLDLSRVLWFCHITLPGRKETNVIIDWNNFLLPIRSQSLLLFKKKTPNTKWAYFPDQTLRLKW